MSKKGRTDKTGSGSRTGIIAGRNAVTEAIRSGMQIERLYIQDGGEGAIRKIISLAKERGVRFDFVKKQKLNDMAGGTVHQGVLATVPAMEYSDVESILKLAEERNEDPFLIILDNIEDPHNLGAVMRTAECAGAHGVIIGKRGSVGLTETVVKASAGAVSYIPCARVTNIGRCIDDLKEKGIWTAACDMGDELYYERDLTGPIAIVIGNEGKGISRLVKEKCDFTLSIPLAGKIDSLNASNAAAIIAYEVRRQRDAG
jgi:23S rRNA (guanosine2251-2'-O)-methyltransferase